MDMGLLVLRSVVGVLMAMHGTQKLFGWFGGHGLPPTAAYFEVLGFRPGGLFAPLAATSELFAGLLVAAGFLGPIGAALMLAVMIVAAGSVHWQHGIFAMSNGVEVPVLYAAAAVALGLAGYGSFSADAVLHLAQVWTLPLRAAVLAAAAAGGFAQLALRRPAPSGMPA